MNYLERKLESNHGRHKPLLAMEGLRGISIFLVFWVHYKAVFLEYMVSTSFSFQLFSMFGKLGNVGVDLFFILSGFLIYGSLIKKVKIDFFKYMWRRIVRIYPTFFVVFCAYIFLSFLFPNENKIPIEDGQLTIDSVVYILQNLLLLPGLFDIEPIITVAWSLSYEFFYYLIIPMVIVCLGLRKWAFKHRVIFWLAVTFLGFMFFGVSPGGLGDKHSRLMMFISGILLFEIYYNCPKNILNRITFKYVGILSLVLALVFCSLLENFGSNQVWKTGVLYVLFFITCLEAFTRDHGSAKLFVIKPLRWLGNMSYSYYLVHGLALKALFMVCSFFVAPDHQFTLMLWICAPLVFCITLIPSFILFAIIEKPISLDVKK